MVMKYGMDEDIGMITYVTDSEIRQSYKPFSEVTNERIDSKIKQIINTAYIQSLKILTENKELMEKMATLLFEKEYFSKEEFERIMTNPENADASLAAIRDEYHASLAALEKK